MQPDFVATALLRLKPLNRVAVVLCGAVIIHLTIGTYHTYGNMLPYIASYMTNYTDSNITLEQLVWVPNFQGCFPFAMVIGGVLSTAFGCRVATFIGCAIMTTGVFLTYWTIKASLSAFLFTYGMMFGFGQGIAYVTAVNTAINWAPNNVGVISGIVAAGFGLSSSIFAPIQTVIINPENFKPTTAGYFTSSKLLARVPSVFYSLAIVYCIMQLIGIAVMCDPPDEKSFTQYPYKKLPRMFDDECDIQLDDCDPDNSDASSTMITNNFNENFDQSLTTVQVLSSSTFYCLFAALFCCSFYGNMYYNLYKTYGETFIDDDLFMAYAFSSGSIVNAFSRIFWGFLADRTSFHVFCLKCATTLATFLLLTMPQTSRFGKWPYFVWLNAMFICLAATHALFIIASIKCFGTANKSTNYGFLILSTVS
uniref:MFS domain-containing protein n=1 Tax=Syphacia muris TaxID=451379 RepID=A0A0N5ABN9_9BILA